MIKNLILGGIAALAVSGPAMAAELWAGTRNNSGNVSLAQFDAATGNMVVGTNVFMDYAGAGQPPQYASFDRLGAIVFGPDVAPVSGVAEPSSWALLIAGFFLTGAASRWRAADRRSSENAC
jgi:hypothetical protein